MILRESPLMARTHMIRVSVFGVKVCLGVTLCVAAPLLCMGSLHMLYPALAVTEQQLSFSALWVKAYEWLQVLQEMLPGKRQSRC